MRWRQILHAWDTTDPDDRRRAVMTVLRRQAVTGTTGRAGAAGTETDTEVLHVCRSTRLPEPAGWVRDLLAGDLDTHRDLPVATDDEPEQLPAPGPVVTRVVYSKDDAQRAWERRRADLNDIAGILNQIDKRAKDLHQRIAEILAPVETDAPYPAMIGT